ASAGARTTRAGCRRIWEAAGSPRPRSTLELRTSCNGWRSLFEDVPDDGIALDAFAQRVVIGDEPVTQHGDGHAMQVTDLRRRPPVEQGAGLGRRHEVLSGARSSAPGYIAPDVFARVLLLRPRRGGEGNRSLKDMPRDGHVIDNVNERRE